MAIKRRDNSRIAAVSKCHTDATLQFVLGMQARDKPPPMIGGNHAHQALMVYIESGGDGASALALFDALHKPFSDSLNLKEDDKFAQWSHENMRDVLHYYFLSHPLDAFPFEWIMGSCEKSVTAMLTPEIEIWAKVDALGREMGIVPVDHKCRGSGITHWYLSQFARGSQPSTYIWAVGEQTGEPVSSMYLNIIDMKKLPDLRYKKDGNPYRCNTHACAVTECRHLHSQHQLKIVTRTPQAIKEWKREAIACSNELSMLEEEFNDPERIQEVRVQGTTNGSCNFCQFKEFCNMGRQPALIESMLVHSPWEPWNQ